jgi:hypothetical protein
MSSQINQFIKEVEKAMILLNQEFSHDFKFLDIQLALAEHYGYSPEDSTKTASHNLTAEKIFEMLKDHDFKLPEESETIELDESILPSGAVQRLDEQTVKSKGEIWVIHKYDKDPFPSNPHAHNEQTGQKLDLSNGDLYDGKNNYQGKNISKKNLLLLRSKVKKITLPTLSV